MRILGLLLTMKPLILIVSAITLVCIAHPCDAEVSINRLLCRVRFTNISETQSVARKVLENAQPAFSFVLSNHEPIPARFQGIDPEDDRNMIEALYEFDVEHITQINRLRYTVISWMKTLAVLRLFSIRCRCHFETCAQIRTHFAAATSFNVGSTRNLASRISSMSALMPQQFRSSIIARPLSCIRRGKTATSAVAMNILTP